MQEVLSHNQAQTRDRRVEDSQKTAEILQIMELFARGIWIAFMSTGGSFTNVDWHEHQSRCDRND